MLETQITPIELSDFTINRITFNLYAPEWASQDTFLSFYTKTPSATVINEITSPIGNNISEESSSLLASLNKSLRQEGFFILDLSQSFQNFTDEGLHEKRFENLSARFGTLMQQNRDGGIIKRVENKGVDPSRPNQSGNSSNNALRPHTDKSDVTLLYYLDPGGSGGNFSLSNSSAIVRELYKNHLNDLRLLTDTFPTLIKGGDLAALTDPVTYAPIIYFTDQFASQGEVRGCIRFVGNFIRLAEIELNQKISSDQQRAIELLRKMAEDLTHIRIINPYKGLVIATSSDLTLHGREAFTDDGDKRRLALRSWVSPDDNITLPSAFIRLLGSTHSGIPRGGNIF
jgi:Taurine catabolism dioxygenase TauD, TfdA family